jgi:hypothetical protein
MNMWSQSQPQVLEKCVPVLNATHSQDVPASSHSHPQKLSALLGTHVKYSAAKGRQRSGYGFRQ